LDKSKLLEIKEDTKINRLKNLTKFHKNISMCNLKKFNHDDYVNSGNSNHHPDIRQIILKEKNEKICKKSLKVKLNILNSN